MYGDSLQCLKHSHTHDPLSGHRRISPLNDPSHGPWLLVILTTHSSSPAAPAQYVRPLLRWVSLEPLPPPRESNRVEIISKHQRRSQYCPGYYQPQSPIIPSPDEPPALWYKPDRCLFMLSPHHNTFCNWPILIIDPHPSNECPISSFLHIHLRSTHLARSSVLLIDNIRDQFYTSLTTSSLLLPVKSNQLLPLTSNCSLLILARPHHHPKH